MTLIEELEQRAKEIYVRASKGKDSEAWELDGEEYGRWSELRKIIKVVKNHSDWTPANQPPKEDGEYYVQASLDINFIADYDIEHNEWVVEGHEIDIDAWQPLPKPYRGE